MDFFLLDSRLSSVSLGETPYLPQAFGNQVAEYTPPSGIYLTLHGRGADGRSVTVETALTEGLSLSFLLQPLPAPRVASSIADADADDATSIDALRQQLLARCQDLSGDDLEGRVLENKPCFYGFEPSAANPLQPRPRRVVELTTHELRTYRAIRQAAEEALHDRPLACGARPCELAGSPHAAAMEARGLAHGTWLRATSGVAARSAADVTLICSAGQLVPLPARAGTVPPLTLASYDIECCSGPPLASGGGGYAFPNAFKLDHAVRSIALARTTTAGGSTRMMRRFFLHTGPQALSAADCAAVAHAEGAADAAEDLEVRWYPNEPALLLGFASLLRDTVKPDILYSYNGNAFDAPYLEQRIELHFPAPPRGSSGLSKEEREERTVMWARRRAAYAWGRTPMDARPPSKLGVPPTEEQLLEIKRKRAAGKIIYEPCTFHAPGVAHHDVLDFGQSLNLETSKLADVASEVLGGTTKTDLEIGDMMDIMQGADVTGWARVAIYNVRDAELPVRIMLAKEQVAFSVQIAAVSGCSLPEVCAGGQQKRLLSMVRSEVRRRGLLFNEPSKLDFVGRPWLCGGGEKVKGATVLDIRPGWYRDPVVACDYSSLYPSIMISRNLCPSKLLLDVVEPTLPAGAPPELAAAVRTFRVEERDEDIVHHHHVLQRAADGSGEGVFPAIASKLLQERKAAKLEMKQHPHGSPAYAILDAKQQALKVICNSLYGALNAVLKGSLYCRPLGGIVTAEGRSAIEAIQAEVRRVEGAEVVAGDTDSVMFKLAGCTLAQAAAVGTQVAAKVTARLHADGALAMELAYEKTMLPSVFVAKKAYAYVCHAPGKPSTTVSMGLMSKKRGTSSLFKSAFIDCERAYLLDPEAFTVAEVRQVQLLALRDMARQIWSDATPPEAFAKTTMLKAEEAYEVGYNAPHVDAARRLVKATGCAWPGNARFAYVQTQPDATVPKSKRKASDSSMELGLFARSKATIDGAYYLSSVHHRFEALLQFTVPDAPLRFRQLIDALERKPAFRQREIATFFRVGPAPTASDLPPLSARSYMLDGQASDDDDASRETAFWKQSLEADARVARAKCVFDASWRPPQRQPPKSSAQLPAPKLDKAPTVESKKRKLEEASAAIAAQPRHGATNVVPASGTRTAKAAAPPKAAATMMAFLVPRSRNDLNGLSHGTRVGDM